MLGAPERDARATRHGARHVADQTRVFESTNVLTMVPLMSSAADDPDETISPPTTSAANTDPLSLFIMFPRLLAPRIHPFTHEFAKLPRPLEQPVVCVSSGLRPYLSRVQCGHNVALRDVSACSHRCGWRELAESHHDVPTRRDDRK